MIIEIEMMAFGTAYCVAYALSWTSSQQPLEGDIVHGRLDGWLSVRSMLGERWSVVACMID